MLEKHFLQINFTALKNWNILKQEKMTIFTERIRACQCGLDSMRSGHSSVVISKTITNIQVAKVRIFFTSPATSFAKRTSLT